MNEFSLSPIERSRKNSKDSATCLAEGCKDLQALYLGDLKGASVEEVRRTWNTWQSMIDRCLIPGHIRAVSYSQRGITVCERWFLFANFASDMGMRPENMSLDRINNEGNYEPLNCRWADRVTQARNTRRNVMVGNLLQVDAARAAGVHESTISRRVARGYTPSEAISGVRA